ncbi:hypothetical protein T484DRAFT_1790605 [Baffinella frigidus]|nr:hypothetical protein T484DRAFT_1790605 [Cryptophyta sp. CCMP2293]
MTGASGAKLSKHVHAISSVASLISGDHVQVRSANSAKLSKHVHAISSVASLISGDHVQVRSAKRRVFVCGVDRTGLITDLITVGGKKFPQKGPCAQ